MNKPTIGFLTRHDPTDRRAWSGIISSMYDQLQSRFASVVHLGRTEVARGHSRWRRVVSRLTRSHAHLLEANQLAASRQSARWAESELRETPCDVIFAPVASQSLAFLQTDVPVLYASDVTWAQARSYYPEYRKFSDARAAQNEEMERRSIARADGIIYSSEWAADGAVNFYGADRSRIRVVPYGANVKTNEVPSSDDLFGNGRLKDDTCRLLFIGKNWLRKGGNIALDTLVALQRLGVPAELTIIGAGPPSGTALPAGVPHCGYLNKNDPAEMKRFCEICAKSHFLLLPTRADCSPIVCCEAAAYGLPVVATHTGGIPELVRDGVNGWTMPMEAGGDEYAQRIAQTFRDRGAYETMARQARSAYDARLNWRAWGDAVAAELRRLSEMRLARSA